MVGLRRDIAYLSLGTANDECDFLPLQNRATQAPVRGPRWSLFGCQRDDRSCLAVGAFRHKSVLVLLLLLLLLLLLVLVFVLVLLAVGERAVVGVAGSNSTAT